MSTPQNALNGTSYSVPCGRVVGGGSVVNAMFFHRSDASFYNTCDDLGARGWSWESLLPYFKKVLNWSSLDVMIFMADL